MSRKGVAQKRDVLPDGKYHDKIVSKFINRLTSDGKRSAAEGVLYGAFEAIEEKITVAGECFRSYFSTRSRCAERFPFTQTKPSSSGCSFLLPLSSFARREELALPGSSSTHRTGLRALRPCFFAAARDSTQRFASPACTPPRNASTRSG